MKYLHPHLITILLALCLPDVVIGQSLDLLIKGGHVIDPKNGLNGPMDVGITDGRIAEVGTDIAADRAPVVVDASGKYVVPGLIDLHAHVFFGTEPDAYLSNSYSSLPPDGFTFRSGVTTVVDAGDAGWRNFDTFFEQTIERSRTRVLAFINIVGAGMKGGHFEQNVNDMDPKMTALVAHQYPEHIVGVKVAHYASSEWEPVDRAVRAGEMMDGPVMVDFGRTQPELPLEELFMEHLRPGDIFTHTFAHVSGRFPIVREGKLEDFIRAAQERGIVFDVGHGGGSFRFDQAVPATQQGFWPYTISTDLHTGSMNGGMKSLSNVISKMLNLGMPLQEVIAATTWNTAQVIGRPDLGHLDVGAEADVAVFSLRTGEFGFIDTNSRKMMGTQKLEAELTLRAGQVVWDLNGLSHRMWDE